MNLNKLNKFKAHYFFALIFLSIGVFSCDEDVREVTLFEKGTANATASATAIESGESITFAVNTTKEYTLEWTFPGGSPATSTDSTVDVTFNNTSFDNALNSEVVLVVKYIDNTKETIKLEIQIAPIDALPLAIPYGGSAVNVPGAIEAENYDEGGQGVGYNDTEEENLAETAGSATYRDDDGVDIEVGTDQTNIGYTNAGEWVNYTVEVTQTGIYDIDFVIASGSASGGTSIRLETIEPLTGNITELGETGDFANTGGSGVYTTVTIPAVTLTAGTTTFRANFTGGETNLDKINITSGAGVPLGPLNIAIATNSADGEAGYVAALEAAGHTVEVVASKYENLTDAGVTELNGFDLVIISRSNNSGSYGGVDPDVRARWMTVTTPVIIISPYIARMSRLQLLNNDGGQDSAGNALDVLLQDHPIFTGIDLTAASTGDITTTGLDVVPTTDAGNGSVIATTGPAGYIALAEWDTNTAAYAGAGTHVGKRMFMAAAGTYGFNDVGTKYFLNVVEYIISGSVIGGGGGGGSVTPLNIAFASDQLDAGGQDLAYVALLEAQGHTVDAVTGAWNNLDATGATALNGYDLVIISRNTNSGDFGDAARPSWVTVTTPIMNLSAFITRNNRLQNFDSGGFDDQSTSTTLTATDPNDPLWIGVTVTGGVSEDVTTDGLDVSNVLTAGTGTVLATDPATGYVAIAEWGANTASYTGGDVFAAKRMFFGTNSGAYALTTAGETLFLNAVNRIGN